MICPYCGLRMMASYRKEDDDANGCTMRRVIEYNECENLRCGVTVTVVIPLMLSQAGDTS